MKKLKAKSAAVKKKGQEPEAEELVPALEPAYSDGQLKSQCKNFFTRMAAGEVKKASDEQVQEAKAGLNTFNELEEQDKAQFAKAFYSNKGTKTFGFIKDYSEKIKASKTVTQNMEENYMTRIMFLFINLYIYIYIYLFFVISMRRFLIYTMRHCPHIGFAPLNGFNQIRTHLILEHGNSYDVK